MMKNGALCVVIAFFGCADPVEEELDGGPKDAQIFDSGAIDADATDANAIDAGEADAGFFDATEPDGGELDVAFPDADPPDLAFPDAMPIDGGETDSGVADTGSADPCDAPQSGCAMVAGGNGFIFCGAQINPAIPGQTVDRDIWWNNIELVEDPDTRMIHLGTFNSIGDMPAVPASGYGGMLVPRASAGDGFGVRINRGGVTRYAKYYIGLTYTSAYEGSSNELPFCWEYPVQPN